MNATVALDVYGTLIDPLGIEATLRSYIGDKAPGFAQAWRDKQLEYLFRRALMRDYRDFPTCTRHALSFIDARLRANLTDDAMHALMAEYRELPAYPGAADALEALAARGCRLYAFSNGSPDDLRHLLSHAGLERPLDGIVSVHATASYKPDPAVYQHFLDSTGSTVSDTWLVSGNPFDVIGADAAGWKTVWLKRDANAVFDPWGVEPTLTISDLRELAGESLSSDSV